MDIGDPFRVRVNNDHRPDECGEDKENVERSKGEIFQTKLDGCVGEIENEIEDERKRDDKWNLLLECHDEHLAERNGDEDVKKRPHRSEDGSRWSERWFGEGLVGRIGGHVSRFECWTKQK